MHIYHQHARNKDTQPAPSSVAPSHSSTSLSSSLSSAASSVLLPAAPPSNSSQSDLATSDQSMSSIPTSHKNRFFPLSLSAAAAARPTAPTMGQAYSRTAPVPASPTSSLGAGSKFKRAWAGRRKKSEDISATFASVEKRDVKGKEREYDVVSAPDHPHPRPADPSRGPRPAKNINLQIAPTKLNVFTGKKSGQSPKPPTFSGSPPPPPPKLLPAQVLCTSPTPTLPPKEQITPVVTVSGHASPSPVPSRTDAADVDASPAVAKQPAVQDKNKDRAKEDWRKSDSTMTSHVTVRPGALGGNRSPRPVSLAESSHSGNTIVPINKRLSALITDAEFATLEESDSSESELDQPIRQQASRRASPTGSLRARNRRSMSLNLGGGIMHKSQADFPPRPPSSTGLHSPGRFISDSVSMSGSPLSTSHDTPTLTRAAASGIIAPTAAAGSIQSTGSNIRSRLAAWTTASASSSPAQLMRELPSPPPQPRRPLPPSHPPSATPPSLRQTAVSMTGGLAPAAGFAMGFGKRAVEKVGRAWGGLSSSSSSASGYSSSSSVAPSFSSRHSDHALRHTPSNQANQTGLPVPPFGGRKTKRRTAGNSSVASSVTSSASDVDQFVTAGPSLGTRLRGPRSTSSGASIVGGLVFRRDLRTCVQETATDSILFHLSQGTKDDKAGGKIQPLEERLLPALVVRCAQHILRWGVQEEGLFRVSGRSSHVAKLRSEFDTGADFDMVECDPGDLDPHAVASIFKAYLRELPESILTAALIPYFESALAAEERARQSLELTSSSSAEGGPVASLPTSPRNGFLQGMRKPPSLSTLAVPGFTGKRAVSDSLLNALTWLISQLPRENRDLLYTVVELIKATAENCKETKMPLGNLLLVFCPSLNMNPALLRVLSEADTIWDGVPKTNVDAEAVDHAPEVPVKGDESDTDAVVPKVGDLSEVLHYDSQEEELLAKNDLDTSEDPPRIIEGNAVCNGPGLSNVEEEEIQRPRACPQLVLPSPITPISPASFKDDNASFVSAQEAPSLNPTRSPSPVGFSPGVPPLSSSAESLSSPSTTSEEPVSPEPVVHVPAAGKLSSESQDSLVIPEPDLSLLPTPRRPQVSATVPFPSSGGSTPQTPITRRKSLALLSFPPMRSEPATTSASASPTWSRPKRPSLHLLFSKRSFSYLSSPTAGSAQAAASAPSLSPSIRAVPASPVPQPSIASSPPKLKMTISSSPIGLGFDDAAHQLRGRSETVKSAPAITTHLSSDAPPPAHVRAGSYTPSVYTTPIGTTPQHTPIADLYQDRSKSVMSFHGDADAVAPAMTCTSSELSQASTTPSIDLVGGAEDAPEDWAHSVLIAAQGEQIIQAETGRV